MLFFGIFFFLLNEAIKIVESRRGSINSSLILKKNVDVIRIFRIKT